MSKDSRPHPATVYNSIRHHVYSIYEKTKDIDDAIGVISGYRLSRELFYRFRAALKGELIVYQQEGPKLKLEPLLDAGVKADFSGTREGRPVNIDVTTNLNYKDINLYADVTQKRGKLYEIAYVNLKSNNVEFYPLRFPICPDCRKFSHYVLFLDTPGAKFEWASDTQDIVRYCPRCETYDLVNELSYIVDSPLFSLKMRGEEDLEEVESETNFDPAEYLWHEGIPIVTFFEKTCGALLSGLAEEEYFTTGHHGEGYWTSRLIWNHPLVRDLEEELDYVVS